ncbi:TIGR00300 family protein [Candidatus Bathyarchaeota archaeon]|nr:TIGR00300 family protein [Candidatus Bathyarchaeota archaeon]MBS7617569.1 TIGR00300 family protein [Candidatus Bathyarchaeota archaeon]
MTVFQNNSEEVSQEVELEGHLIDSLILPKIFDIIMDLGGDFEVLEFQIGRRKMETSYAKLLIKGRSRRHLEVILKEVYRLGAITPTPEEVQLKEVPADMVLPDGFYVTTNHPTYVYYRGNWLEVEGICMDKVISVDPSSNRAYCKSIRDVKAGDLIVVGERGVRVKPPEYPREGSGIFEFMTSRSSPEKPSTSIIKVIAEDIVKIKKSGGRIVVVAGPAVVHTGADEALAKIIRMGFVDALLSGNALAVHDIEYNLFGTSLGMSVKNGKTTAGSNRNHLAAINEIVKAGSIKDAVTKGIVKSGIFYECVINGIPYVLAGSIRDDGPLPDVITDTVEAQKLYKLHLKGASMVLMLATMLHSIAVGNMLPSTVKVVCVDINPATLIKLLDRGSAQALGVVSDVGTFLPMLAEELAKLKIRG